MKNRERRILIAVDLSENSLKAVDYVGRLLSCHEEAEITLMHVIRAPSPDTMPDEAERLGVVRKAEEESLALMEDAGGRLTACGIPEHRIHIRIQTCDRLVSVAQLILEERQKGDFGTVVVGKRGVSKREEFLFGSTSSSVMREARDCAVWIIP